MNAKDAASPYSPPPLSPNAWPQKAHQEQVRVAAGGVPKDVSAATMRSRKFAPRKKARKALYSAICDEAVNIKGHPTQYNITKKHLEKVVAASA